ncbi:hypothetical protein [Marinicella meishanensis]|uniref:hypothetical protein n=1 Tax=Marinicella meishanensis TaxID=2873263 RepID=UPI001CBCA66B|nr:hypothetical protein [Marinicella sp. NBU2979]
MSQNRTGCQGEKNDHGVEFVEHVSLKRINHFDLTISQANSFVENLEEGCCLCVNQRHNHPICSQLIGFVLRSDQRLEQKKGT